MNVRLAKNADGKRIQQLVEDNGFPSWDFLDWTDIEPYWLVAEDKDIIGCVQTVLAKPVGRLEYIAVERTLSHMQKARALKMLIKQASLTLSLSGVNVVGGTVGFDNKGLKKIYKRRGAVTVMQGNVMMARNAFEVA